MALLPGQRPLLTRDEWEHARANPTEYNKHLASAPTFKAALASAVEAARLMLRTEPLSKREMMSRDYAERREIAEERRIAAGATFTGGLAAAAAEEPVDSDLDFSNGERT